MAGYRNIRWRWLKATFLSSLYTAVAVFIIFQIWFMIQPASRNIVLSVGMSLIVFLFSFIVHLVAGYNENRLLKKRLEDLSTYITILARGNLSQRMKDGGDDEIGTITRDLNELANKIQKQVSTLQKMAKEKTELADQAHTAAAIEERQRLARDLHDAVSQQLFALSMMSSASLRLLDRDVEAAKKQMEEVATMAVKAQGEMRALLLHLRPVHLSGDPLDVGVRKLVNELQDKSGIHFDLDMKEWVELPKSIEDHLFRMIQEGLSNALRHAEASTIKIQLYEKNHDLYVHLRDNGQGFDMTDEKKSSYGLNTMQERCEEIGGTMKITSQRGEGTALDVRIPLSREGEHNG